MKKTELAMVIINIIGFLGIALLLLTGHSGFALKFTNIFVFVLLTVILYKVHKL